MRLIAGAIEESCDYFSFNIGLAQVITVKIRLCNY